MTDGITDVAEPVATTGEAAQPTPTSYIAPDGTLQDGWKDAYLTDDIKEESIFSRVKNVQGVFKTLANAERMVGKNKVAIPDENSGDEAWSRFYEALGRPDSPDKYDLTRPENLPAEFWNEDLLKEAKNVFHKIGLSPKQAKAILDFDTQRSLKEIESYNALEQQKELKFKEDYEAMKKELGNAYDQKIHIGNIALEKGVNGNEELKQRVVEKFGKDPDFTKIMISLGEQFSESKAIDFKVTETTPAQTQEKINELMSSDAFMNKKHPNHNVVIKQISNLYKEISG